MIFSNILNALVVACPGCSYQGMRLRLKYPEDAIWAWLIVIFFVSAIPLLSLCGMRFSRRRPHPSKKRTAWMTTALILLYVFSIASFSFANMIMSHVFFPLEIILMVLLAMAWNGGIIAMLLIPLQIGLVPLYMYAVVKIMQRFDRKLYWNTGKSWRRLRQIKHEPRQKTFRNTK